MLDANQRYYQDIFEDLADGRGYTQSGTPLPIPPTEILAYFEMFYISSISDRARLFKMIKAQDRVFVKVLSEKAANAAKQT